MKLFQFDYKEQSLVVVIIQDANLQRMKGPDPITLQTFGGGFLRPAKYPNKLRLIIAFEHDICRIEDYIKSKDFDGLIAHLERGYKFIPTLDGVTL